jgi:hypothetical protein
MSASVSLCRYVAAILERATQPLIVAREAAGDRWLDQGFAVCREVCRYRFADGTVILRTEERDEFPDGAACAECWITYEVIAVGSAGSVEPQRKTFDNACRESYWLSYHLA